MSRTLWATTASALAASLVIGLSACSDSTNPSGGSTISASETSDIGEGLADEVDQSVASLSIEGAAAGKASMHSAASFSVAGVAPLGSSCATVSNTTDTDGDGAPDDATYTFALPACSFTGFRGGSLEITGTVELSDPTPANADFAYQATLHDLEFNFTGPMGNLSFTATRNGTRVLTGNAAGASLSNNITVERTFPVRQPASVSHNLLLTFTPDEGQSLALGQPLPNGTFTKSGTFTWTRGSVTRTFAVTTVVPLVWDASCTTDRKITSGEIHATLGSGGYIKMVWSGCGVDPVRTFVPAS
ncbi:MAG: hypothetical protein ACREL3_10180 [Gemmatimonadales bacterium]